VATEINSAASPATVQRVMLQWGRRLMATEINSAGANFSLIGECFNGTVAWWRRR